MLEEVGGEGDFQQSKALGHIDVGACYTRGARFRRWCGWWGRRGRLMGGGETHWIVGGGGGEYTYIYGGSDSSLCFSRRIRADG